MIVPLARDVLDVQVIDRNGEPMGKVDGIVLELRDDAPPRVEALEISPEEGWGRLGERFKRWALFLSRPWQRAPRPYRVPWAWVIRVERDIELGVAAEDTPAFELERWLQRKLVDRIPGSG